jgi:hypothetical protein
MNKFATQFTSIWLQAVDSRRYALVRISFAAIVLLNIIHLWPLRDSFLSSAGSIGERGSAVANPGLYLSVFGIASSPLAVSLVFLIAAAATVLLAMGKYARAMLVVVAWFLISVIHRSPVATAGWDFVLCNVAFVLLFSPLGETWNARNLWRSHERGPRLPRYGLVLLQIQIFAIYWQTVFDKISSPYWRDGEFLTYFMMSHHGRFAGTWVLGWHEFFDKLTYLTLFVELAIPILLWIPAARVWGLAAGIGLHLSIAIFGAHLSMFSFTMIMTYSAFINFGRRSRDGSLSEEE